VKPHIPLIKFRKGGPFISAHPMPAPIDNIEFVAPGVTILKLFFVTDAANKLAKI
jgi:hypothetical protein